MNFLKKIVSALLGAEDYTAMRKDTTKAALKLEYRSSVGFSSKIPVIAAQQVFAEAKPFIEKSLDGRKVKDFRVTNTGLSIVLWEGDMLCIESLPKAVLSAANFHRKSILALLKQEFCNAEILHLDNAKHALEAQTSKAANA